MKQKGFKWKTVNNEVKTGQRIEIMECMNTAHKDQTDTDKCVIYRQGIKKEDIFKEPFSFKIASVSVIGSKIETSENISKV